MKKLIIASLLMAAPAFAAQDRVKHCAMGFGGAMAFMEGVLQRRPQTEEVQQLRKLLQVMAQLNLPVKACQDVYKKLDEQNEAQ